MKKFSRCVLVLVLVAVLSAVGGYVYFDKTSPIMYESIAQIIVSPGADSEASVRAKNGSLNNDFQLVFKSSGVISEAQKILGTTEDIAQYITVSSPADSNIINIKCVNPDYITAKKYVDAVATSAVKATDVLSVKSMTVLEWGKADSQVVKPDLIKKTCFVVGVAMVVCLIIEIIILLFMAAFKSDEDENEYLEYERRFGKSDDEETKDSKKKKKNKKNNESDDNQTMIDVNGEDEEFNRAMEAIIAKAEEYDKYGDEDEELPETDLEADTAKEDSQDEDYLDDDALEQDDDNIDDLDEADDEYTVSEDIADEETGSDEDILADENKSDSSTYENEAEAQAASEAAASREDDEGVESDEYISAISDSLEDIYNEYGYQEEEEPQMKSSYKILAVIKK